jgi:polyisoprenoid-binding protein YceI
MKKFLLLLFMGFSGLLSAQQVKINETKTEVSFLFLDDDVDGIFSGFKFTGDLNLDSLESSTISGSVASKTIDTDNWLRNRHLRNKYFKTDDFPLLKFRSTSITPAEEGFIVQGTLTIKDISKPVTFRCTNKNNMLIAKATINASDYNIYIHDDAVRNKLSINIRMPFTSE